jgi:hypothetical protein
MAGQAMSLAGRSSDTQRQGEITSAVANVTAEEFVNGSARDAAFVLADRVPGLGITTPSGDPHAGTQIRLRGRHQLLAFTTHEVAHRWWVQQVMGADVQGSQTLLVSVRLCCPHSRRSAAARWSSRDK